MDNIKKTIYQYTGERLRRARMVKGYSQIELAKKLGYSDSSTIYKIEKGVQKIPYERIRQICDVLDIDYAYLTKGLEMTLDNEGHTVVIEKHLTDKSRADMTSKAVDLIYKASEKQLEQIVKILEILVGASSDGDADLE